MNVLGQIDQLWKEHEGRIEKRIQGWVHDLNAQREKVVAARRQFRQWAPLRVYTSVARAKKKGASTFSLRYCGQEVATLILKPDGKLYVSIAAKTQSANAQYFGVPIGTNKSFPWDSPEGRKFRRQFKQHACESQSTGTPREHFLESTIIQEMQLKTSSKFGRILSQVQPVLLYGILPFQVPIPFAATNGEPKFSEQGGEIDILARRRGEDGHVRLSVWELKRPGHIRHAVFQSYIYAVTLRYMLRSSSGAEWFKLFGFRRALPVSLDVESVVLLSEAKREEYAAQVAKLCDDNALRINADRIILSAAFYDNETLQLTRFEGGIAHPLRKERTG